MKKVKNHTLDLKWHET